MAQEINPPISCFEARDTLGILPKGFHYEGWFFSYGYYEEDGDKLAYPLAQCQTGELFYPSGDPYLEMTSEDRWISA